MNIPSRIPLLSATKSRPIPAAPGPPPQPKIPYGKGKGLGQAQRDFTAEGAPAPRQSLAPLLPATPRGARGPNQSGTLGASPLTLRPAPPTSGPAKPKPG